MKIVIAGAGAMGCLFGGMLFKAGHEVWLFEKDLARVKDIQAAGVSIERNGVETRIPLHAITPKIEEAGTADLIVLVVKSYDTAHAAQDVVPAVGAHTAVVTLQNGLGNIESMQQFLSAAQILAGTTSHGATMLASGRIRHAGMGPTVIGPIVPEGMPRAVAVQKIFEPAGIQTALAEEIYPVLWGKLLVNVGINALTAIMRVKNGRVGDVQHLHAVMRRAVQEGAAVAGRLGIALPYNDLVARTEEVCRATSENISSMHQDIRAGRCTEIDSLNGVVVSYGKRLGVQTPVNSMLVDLVKSIELHAVP